MYERRVVDLTTVFDSLEVAAPSRRITEVIILDMPSGASVNMKVGDGNPFFSVTRAFAMEPKGDDESNRGLYLQNVAAQAGVTFEIIVVYGSQSGEKLNAILT